MVIVKDESYLVSEKIQVGQFFGLPDGDAFIEIREPGMKTSIALQKAAAAGESEGIIDAFSAALPGLIVDHSLMKTDTEKMTADEVVGVIMRKVGLFTHVITEYKEKVLFSLGERSDGK
jgi:hypothetical protein